jgi:hypothetical protein
MTQDADVGGLDSHASIAGCSRPRRATQTRAATSIWSGALF